ncbi:discoidin domain-containing protein [Virgibacillus salexigens]|nr:discoidin domain-containing protein [Virgibacillus massiliensis]
MDILSYGTSSKADKQEKVTRNEILGEGITGSFLTMKERIDKIDKSIQNVTRQADKLIINNAVNIMKANAKLNAIAQSKKYHMHNMIFDDLLDLSGIDSVKSKHYKHDTNLGTVTTEDNQEDNFATIVTTIEETDAHIDKAVLSIDAIEPEPPSILDLSNGEDNSFKYIAPNGVTVKSSAKKYEYKDHPEYYALSHLFNGTISISDGSIFHSDPHSYWLADSKGSQSLIFDFQSIGNPVIETIRVYPRARNDASSNYRILVSDDDINYEEVVPWVTNTHDDNTPYETMREYELLLSNRFVRFELTRNGSWGIILSEIEFIVDSISTKIKYYISRNGGETWEKIKPNTLFYFSDSDQIDNKLCLKVEIPKGAKLSSYAITWS